MPELVARVAGVSRATVSRVVNGAANVDPELRAMVRQAIETTGYVPNKAARSLVTRHTGTVALVVSEPERHDDDLLPATVLSDPFFGRVVHGALSVLGPHDSDPVLMLVDSEPARKGLVRRLRQEHIDGMLLISIYPDDALLTLLSSARADGAVQQAGEARAGQLRRRRPPRGSATGRRPARRVRSRRRFGAGRPARLSSPGHSLDTR